MIGVGENPESNPRVNKFMSVNHEGHRGVLLAVRKDGKEAIVLALTDDAVPQNEPVIRWGRLYLVREIDAGQWPLAVEAVSHVPDSKEWACPLAA